MDTLRDRHTARVVSCAPLLKNGRVDLTRRRGFREGGILPLNGK